MPPARARLLAVLLIIGLTAMSAYAGCRQLRPSHGERPPGDRIQAVETIHAYLERVRQVMRWSDDSARPEEEAQEGG